MNYNDLTDWFPNISPSAEIISYPDRRYNCVMHALGGKSFYIQPIPKQYCPVIPGQYGEKFFWPTDFPFDFSVETMIEFFKLFKYEICEDDSYSLKFRKLAIFADKANDFKHVALQFGPDIWTSKLGYENILKHSLADISGGTYGNVYCFMRRPRTIPKEFDFEVFERYLK